MSKEYTGEERRHGERITKLEVQIEGLDSLREEMRISNAAARADSNRTYEEIGKFRHDLFKVVNPLIETVARHEAQLNDKEEGLVTRAQKNANRITVLEHWRTMLVGAYAASIIFIAGLWALFSEKIKRLFT